MATINTTYLSWRYLALREGIVEPGTAICSITEFVDCDKVLMTPQARAFFVPNALLGFGFFFGCLLWFTLGMRLDEGYHYHLIRTLIFWLLIATLMTFWFFYLLVQLPAFCPLCPISHFLTYILLILSFILWRRTEHKKEKRPVRSLVFLVGICVSQFFLWLSLWFTFSGK